MARRIHILALLLLGGVIIGACAAPPPPVMQVTVAPTQNNAPIYTETSTVTPSTTPTLTPVPPTETPTITPSPTATPTLPPSATPPLVTLTRAAPEGAPPAIAPLSAPLMATAGWSCDDFPCEDDLNGFMRRIGVPDGFTLAHVGRFPGQPMQITYGRDGRLYATILEGGTRNGAVYVMNADGTTARYSETLVSPLGLAFQPATDVLYVSARVTLEDGGGIWRVLPDGTTEPVITDLPCCFQVIDNQPNGMIFAPDGYLYLGVGALTDQAEPPPGPRSQYTTILPYEAEVLRVDPHTGTYETYAKGIRNPYDLAFTSDGQLYVTDNGLLSGYGDRLLALEAGAHYGFPFWRMRGCDNCPTSGANTRVSPDLYAFPRYTLPRGMVAYHGTQYPANYFDSLFIALWNGIEGGQRIVRIDPRAIPTDPDALAAYQPEAFVTGLIRPIDVVVDPDGALVIADYIYGHIWRVTYTG